MTFVYLLTDARMMLHGPPFPSSAAILEDDTEDNFLEQNETAKRIPAIYHRLLELETRLLKKQYPWAMTKISNDVLLKSSTRRFVNLPCKEADRQTIELAHSPEHYDFIKSTSKMTNDELVELTDPADLYYNQFTFQAATLAAGGVVECVKATTERNATTKRAIALVRPPGHHASRDKAMGFCYFNNVAVAAKYALQTKRASRVFIFDLDIHHGNGTQDITFDDPNIFYLSIHRASFRADGKNWFYPGTGASTETGGEGAEGTNLNIPWEQSGMGNFEYAIAMTQAVIPAMHLFNPDLIIVSAGLDAVKGDSLGDCEVSAAGFYAITNALLNAAGRNTSLVVELEGGYNLELNADCMEAIALALLDEPWKEDKFEYDQCEYFSSRSLLPIKKSLLLEQRNPYSLSRYLDNDKLLSGKGLSNATRHALSAVRKSARAFAKSIHLYSCDRPTAFCHDEYDEDTEWAPHVPLKKRRVLARSVSVGSCR